MTFVAHLQVELQLREKFFKMCANPEFLFVQVAGGVATERVLEIHYNPKFLFYPSCK
jgi:hypothetical protein